MAKKKTHISYTPVAKAMVEDRRRWTPRVVENKKRKNALKPKYKNWEGSSGPSHYFLLNPNISIIYYRYEQKGDDVLCHKL